MSDLSMETQERAIAITFDEALYPKDAVYGAAYVFIDRCYVHLDRPADGKISVSLSLKPGSTLVLAELGGEFQNELLGQTWRRQLTEENRVFIDLIATKALAGAAGPPGLDDLLNMDDGGAAFDDPLGIAMSWEDKYKKKKPEAGEAAPGDAAAVEAAAEEKPEGQKEPG